MLLTEPASDVNSTKPELAERDVAGIYNLSPFPITETDVAELVAVSFFT